MRSATLRDQQENVHIPNMYDNDKVTQDTESIMELVNQLIVNLKNNHVLDNLLSCVSESDSRACLDANTLRHLIERKLKAKSLNFDLTNVIDQLINLIKIDRVGAIPVDNDSLNSPREIELINLSQLKNLCRPTHPVSEEPENQSLRTDLKKHLIKQGFMTWISPKKSQIQIKVKSKK